MRRLISYVPVYKRPLWRGQVIALVTVAASLLARGSIDPFIPGGLFFNFLFPSVLIAGLFGGVWSGVTTALVGGSLAAFIWIPPRLAIALHGEGVFRLLSFFALAAMMIVVTSFVHITLDRMATAEARAKTIASEMKHRVQNNLALVQAIVRQTFQTSDDLMQARKLLEDRLAALARAHDLIENISDEDVGAEVLIKRALEPFGLQRFALEGSPSVMISPDVALSLMLLFHELATNASKYGALSNSAGRVEISWAAEPTTKRVSFDWKERFGPPVSQPSRFGFGSRLLRAAFSEEGASANIDYEPDGVHCMIDVSARPTGNAKSAMVPPEPVGESAAA